MLRLVRTRSLALSASLPVPILRPRRPAHAAAVSPKKVARAYSFATSQYNSAFGELPEHDSSGLRTATLKYLEETFDQQRWFDDPIQTVIDGQPAGSTGSLLDTCDAAGRVNGRQLLADDATMEKLIAWMQTMTDAAKQKLSGATLNDLRSKIRDVETKLLSHQVASQLVANQAVDFLKQDGITEIEESLQANQVERKLNDFLAQDAALGKLEINRAPVLVATVCVCVCARARDL
jgi:hypothetical protein